MCYFYVKIVILILQNISYPFYLPSFQNFHAIGNLDWDVNMVHALFISL